MSPPKLTPPPTSLREGLTLAQRNGLRYVAGLRGLFMPAPEVLDVLYAEGLVEPSSTGLAGYRPTGKGTDILPKIGARG